MLAKKTLFISCFLRWLGLDKSIRSLPERLTYDVKLTKVLLIDRATTSRWHLLNKKFTCCKFCFVLNFLTCSMSFPSSVCAAPYWQGKFFSIPHSTLLLRYLFSNCTLSVKIFVLYYYVLLFVFKLKIFKMKDVFLYFIYLVWIHTSKW